MHYLDTAFAQLAFAAKLYDYAEDGKLNLEDFDRPLSFDEGGTMWVLPDRVFHSHHDLRIACGNQVSIAFGAAAITLNRCREEFEQASGIPLRPQNGNAPQSEDEHFAELVYQIRNAFAHDISEPRWEIRSPTRRCVYLVDRTSNNEARITVDATNLHGERFDFGHIGGIDTLYRLRLFGRRYWGI